MNVVDDFVYHKVSVSKYFFLVLYVNNILLASNDLDLLHETKKFLSNKFEMKDLGDTSFVLGIKIHRESSQDILELSQKIYIEKVFKGFDMQNYKPGDTHVAKEGKLSLK